tara:strand:+ start:36 stop:518 length:483 start_codon:yes stop_codon:yes gene_type:complete
MAKSGKLLSLIKEIVKQEVKKEVRQIFINEGIKSMANSVPLTEESVVEVLPKRKPKPKEEITYTKNPVLNDILNETANGGETDEYPSMDGGTFDSSKMAQAMGYGGMLGSAEDKRKVSAIQTAQAAGADTSNKAVQDVMGDLTKDYRGVMKALNKKDGKI